MNDLDTFFLVEEYTADGDDLVEVDIHETATGTVAIPTKTGKKGRRPIDPGYVLGWTEWNADNPDVQWRRRGLVMAWAPNQQSLWVIPDDRRDGEGAHVVVRGVAADSADEAHRIVGGPGDFRSSPEWQSPRTLLPRPHLRVDRMFNGAGDVVADAEWLHTDPGCPFPRPWAAMSERIEPGTATPVEDCYVFEGALHPMSVRPATRDGLRLVPACSHCMRAKLPD